MECPADVRAGRARRPEQDLGAGIPGARASRAGFQQRQIVRRIDVADAGFARQILLVPDLVRLDLAA